MALQEIIKNRLKRAPASGSTAEEGGTEGLTRADILHIIKGVGVAVFSGVLGASQAMFSAYPFGVAFLSVTNKYVTYSYVGLILSALFSRGYAIALAVTYTAIFMLRLALSRLMAARSEEPASVDSVGEAVRLLMERRSEDFCENILIRCAVSAFAAFIFGLYRLISGGFLYYDLFGLLTGFLVCPLITRALGGLFTSDSHYIGTGELSRVALMFISVFALREYTVFSFSPAFILAFFFTLWAAADLGALKGCTVGLLAGLASGGIGFSAAGVSAIAYSIGAAPCIMAAAGLTIGAMWKFSRIAALICGCVIGTTLGLVVDGFAIMPRLIPDLVCAAALFMPLSRLRILPRIPIFTLPTDKTPTEDSVILEKKQTDREERMAALSEAFAHLSDTLYALSDRMKRPGVAELKSVCDEAFDGFCKKCSMHAHCFEKDYPSTLDAQGKITAALYKNGRLDLSYVPEYFKNRCYNITGIVDEINLSQARLVERLMKSDKTEAFAVDYEAISKLLSKQLAEGNREYEADDALAEKIRRSLKYMGIHDAGVVCYGRRKKQIFIGGVEASRMKLGAKEIRRAIENTAEILLTPPEFKVEDDSITVSLASRRRFYIESAAASGKKQSESANGDSYIIFENRDDYLYSLISDGMGSGRSAAITSRICTEFARRMLGAGNGKAVTLEMLNGFIRSRTERGGECSATIDLAEVDLITGEAAFVKSGAAPSFILRGGSLYRLESRTIPLGIMPKLDAEKIRFELSEGDIIVMVSDGVAQSLDDGVWLANLLTYEWEDDLEAMSQKILQNASLQGARSDDMTAVLLRVKNAPVGD